MPQDFVWNAGASSDPTWAGGEVYPTTGDSGVDYGQGVLDLLKYGVGAYVGLESQRDSLEDKRLYMANSQGLTQAGQPAGAYPGAGVRTAIPAWVWLAAAAVGVVLLARG